MNTLIIDVPSYITDDYENVEHLVQERVFEFIKHRPTKYLRDYKILFNPYSDGAKYIKEMIDDWDLEYYAPVIRKPHPTNKDKVDVIKKIVKEGKKGDCLIFFDYEKAKRDLSNKIMLDQVANEPHIYLKVCRLDYNLDMSL